MSRRIVAIVVAIAALCAAGAFFVVRARKQAAAPPVTDVILITIDTLRADSLGYTGNGDVNTPFLDSLAAKGTVFTHAHAHNVVTLASHTNILTGLYPWQHGVRDNAGFTLGPEHPTIAAELHAAGFATGAFVSAFPLDSRFGLDRGFDVYEDGYRSGAAALDFAVQERPGSETLALASQWWRSSTGRKRFLFIHLYEPHAPYLPPEPFAQPYRAHPYLGEVAAVDAMLAQTLGPILEESPRALVIVTSDHGESLGEHGEKTHGLFAYESTLAVPLIVIDPSRAPSRDDRYVRHIDIAPTIFARTAVAKPEPMKGVSLFDRGERTHSYFEALSASLNRGWAPLIGTIDGGKKLIELPLPELYDLASDPKETKNLYRDDRRAVAALRALLKADAPSTTSARGSVDSEEQASLMSLGYISGTSAKTTYSEADDPKNLIGVDGMLHDSIAAYQAGDLTRALSIARKIAETRPDMQLAQEMVAFLLAQNDRPDEAIRVLERRIESGRANDAVRIRLGLLLSETGRAREAIPLLQPFAPKGDPDVLNAYGIALADSGNVRDAAQQFTRILDRDPKNARAHQNLGIVALRAGQPVPAREHLERAIALDPDLPIALNALGVVEARSGNNEAAIARWSKAVALDKSQYDALFNIGTVALSSGKRDVARRALTEFLDRAPAVRFAAERREAAEMLRSVSR